MSKNLPLAFEKKAVIAISSQSTDEFLLVLQALLSFPVMSATLTSTSQPQQSQQSHGSLGSRGMHFLDLILNAILVEDEINPLTAYIIFLGRLTEMESFEARIFY